MRALTIRPGPTGGMVGLEKVTEPTPNANDLLVEAVALGVCGTDRSLVNRGLRTTPPGRDWLILGHESLGRVVQAPADSAFQPGDLVTGIVRRPDPGPCVNCRAGDLDICLDGGYTERGIRGQDGYGAQRYALDEAYAVRVDSELGITGVLVEPTSIVAKAWERVDASARRPGGRALILGAGPIGLLAAQLGAQRGYEVHVVDQVSSGPKVRQAQALPATYHQGTSGLTGEFDAVVECTGELVPEAIAATARGGSLCLIAGGHAGSAPTMEVATFSGALVGGNRTFSGVSSSNRRHFEAAQAALRVADRSWLEGMLTAVVALDDYSRALNAGPDTIKAVIQFS